MDDYSLTYPDGVEKGRGDSPTSPVFASVMLAVVQTTGVGVE